MNNSKKNFIKLSFFIFLTAWFFVGYLYPARAQVSGDAIAVRIIPNPEHYSAARWYREKKFTGSPQKLMVDGYEAVRDGRTVYVNAANVDTAANRLYTNIYLISYNQKAEGSTVDIFGRILGTWKFNTNLPAPGICSLTVATACVNDSECPSDEYCSSQKAKVTRDTRRLSDLTDLGERLESYKTSVGSYPILAAGTYLPYKSLSVWPSWKKVLGQILKYGIPVDPVNILGDCGGSGYNPLTCWDENNKTFPTDLNIPAFPVGSRVYFYSTDPAGKNADYCALLETNYPNIGSYNCITGAAVNHAPQFTVISLPPGDMGKPYIGYLEAVDPDGDALSWSLSGSPILQDSSAPNQKKIYVPLLNSNVTFSVTVDDGRGGTANASFTIFVKSTSVPTASSIANFDIIIGGDISFTALGAGAGLPLRFDFAGIPSGFNSAGWLDLNWHDWHVSGRVIDRTKTYGAALIVYDINGIPSVPVNFSVTVRNNPPVISSGSLPGATGCLPYEFTVAAADPDGHAIKFSFTGPKGLVINEDTGVISGRPEVAAGDYPVRVTVRDEYYDFTQAPFSAEAVRDYTLHVDDEAYTITMPPVYSFYAAPAGIKPEDFYHTPLSYFGVAGKSTPNLTAWKMTINPNPLMSGVTAGLNSDNGELTAASTNNALGAGGYSFTAAITATTYDCNITRSGSVALTVYPNEWCGDGIVQSIEQCESPGSGTAINNQWQCVSCSWSGGWCGNGICETAFEAYTTCPGDCVSAFSEFSVCTDLVNQPDCYTSGTPHPTLTWKFSATTNEYCDCDGVPAGDCFLGYGCAAAEQVLYMIEVDNNADYSSPTLTIGPITSGNYFHYISTSGLNFGYWYFWRMKIMDTYGTWSDWVQCTGPFLTNPHC